MGNNYFPLNGLRVCIDSVLGDELEGRFYSPMEKNAICFESYGEFLLKGEALFERMGYPQAFLQNRSFHEVSKEDNRYKGVPREVLKFEEIVTQKGSICTFQVIVTSRRNATWQGVLQQEDGKDIDTYSSVMELLKLLKEQKKIKEKLSET